MVLRAPANKTIVITGKISDAELVESSTPDVNIHELEECHEEADTHIIPNSIRSQAFCIVVAARDNYVLVLLLAHFAKMHVQECGRKLAPPKKHISIPIHSGSSV